jgi:Cu/Ag efflux protein CusF
MRVWKVVVLVNLALVLGAGWGWAWWGRRAMVLGDRLAEAQGRAEQLSRELAAARADRETLVSALQQAGAAPPGPGSGAAGGPPGEQQWQVRGVVRAVLPDIHVIVMTHEDIPGYMRSMTMGFRTASPTILESLTVGDLVRFTLRGTPPNVVVTAIDKTPEGGRP